MCRCGSSIGKHDRGFTWIHHPSTLVCVRWRARPSPRQLRHRRTIADGLTLPGRAVRTTCLPAQPIVPGSAQPESCACLARHLRRVMCQRRYGASRGSDRRFSEAGLDTIANLARIASGQKPRESPSAHETVATHRTLCRSAGLGCNPLAQPDSAVVGTACTMAVAASHGDSANTGLYAPSKLDPDGQTRKADKPAHGLPDVVTVQPRLTLFAPAMTPSMRRRCCVRTGACRRPSLCSASGQQDTRGTA
jgi:hypothetical protein